MQTTVGGTLKSFIDGATELIGTSVAGFFLTLATVMFFYAVVRFIMNRASGNTKGLEDAKGMLGWSVLALALMFSIWGVVALFQTVFQNPEGNAIVAPSVKVSGSNTGSGSTSAGRTGVTGGTTSGTAATSMNGNKKQGEGCKVLEGSKSECVVGYLCKKNPDYGGNRTANYLNICTKI